MTQPDIHTSEGWAIIDDRGRPWGEAMFASEEAALETVKACGMHSARIARAKRVEWYATKPGNRTPTMHDSWVIEEASR
ncbi:hypothetical protein [Aureimonas mangrovi]|uniref:hypothetical protein n=1 Tax=Aureimonas mangrovi TaxID=2758041 RepID=UPI00163D5431|nr:hypothetical protein [Aureimonas mangrovi]